MHFSTAFIICAAGASASPLWNMLLPKDVVTVVEEAVIYETVTAVAEPSSSTTEAATSYSRNWDGHKSYHHTTSSTTEVVVSSSTTSSTPEPTTSSTTSTTPPPTTSSTSTSTYVAPTTSSTSTSISVTPTTSTSTAASSTSASGSSPSNDGVSLLSIINKWRATVPVADLEWSDQLQANAQKTGNDNNGVTQNHELNTGSYAQVITPGMESAGSFDLQGDTPFELSYVAWLCEIPTSALTDDNNQCQIVSDVLNMQYDGTGHADILRSSDYSTIGCAYTQNPKAASDSPYQGLWVCDLGL